MADQCRWQGGFYQLKMEEIYNHIDNIQDLDELKKFVKVILEEKNELEIRIKKYTNPLLNICANLLFTSLAS